MRDDILQRVSTRVDHLRKMRDKRGWPEPRTVEDLRNDPRVQLRNRLDGSDEDLELAAAVILLVAEDRQEGAVS